MRWFHLSVVACLIALSGPTESRAATSNATAPPFELVTFTGEAYSNNSLRGRPVLLVFWAPWCRVCQRDLPLIGEFARRDKPAPLRILSIGFADTRRTSSNS